MERQHDIDYMRTRDITVQDVKSCPEFAHFTDEQAGEVVETLKLLAKIAFDFDKKHFQHAEK